MTEQPAAAAAAPPAAPAPAAQQQAPPPAAPAQEEPRVAGKTGLTTDQQVQLGELVAARDAAAVAAGAVQMTVEEPHAAFTYGGVTVTTDPTTVPASIVPAIVQAAAEAGVTLTQQESES
jgi:hypothetical protein